MITDLFSHKIHSSGNEWPDKLTELAAIFNEFDGKLFDRSALEERLTKISPRASYLISDAASGDRLDVSKFRDEISAYPVYLGLYYLEQSLQGWRVKVSETAKRFLLIEEPDVGSFLRLQLPLFQYPNAMGAAYKTGSNSLRVQANARDKTLYYIQNNIHFSPLRLITQAIKAKSEIEQITIFDALLTYEEIFALANDRRVSCSALPDLQTVKTSLDDYKSGNIAPPNNFERRFHTLKHTEIFELVRGAIKFRNPVNLADRTQLKMQVEAILSIDSQFDVFDGCLNGEDIKTVIQSGAWGHYFDGVRVLPSAIVDILADDMALDSSVKKLVKEEEASSSLNPEVYEFRERGNEPAKATPYNRKKDVADPEARRIKLQRRNLIHKELVEKMDALLRALGATPKENEHIDLFAKIPEDGSFIFEMKSGGKSILEQIRKGLSQLYEYRYRYKDAIQDDEITLCLVLPTEPTAQWLIEYLCEDRGINLCWFEETGDLVWPEKCPGNMNLLSGSPN